MNINDLKTFLLDLFFPKFCIHCKREGNYLCEDCQSLLSICEYQYCLCQQSPIRIPPSFQKGKCARCQNKNLNGLYFALSYKDDILVKKVIHFLKYPPHLKELAETLADILMNYFLISNFNITYFKEEGIFVPIPLEIRKLKIRGYNQAEEIAKSLARKLGVPLAVDLLIKKRKTESQVRLNKEEREKNLKGAFAINSESPFFYLGKKKTIFLIDDVYTTGATMEECAKVLKEAGFKKVWGIAVAREG